jgi:hypothetical protein
MASIQTQAAALVVILSTRAADLACRIEDATYAYRQRAIAAYEVRKLNDAARALAAASRKHSKSVARLNELKQAKHEAVTAFDVEIAKLRNKVDDNYFAYRKLLGFSK